MKELSVSNSKYYKQTGLILEEMRKRISTSTSTSKKPRDIALKEFGDKIIEKAKERKSAEKAQMNVASLIGDRISYAMRQSEQNIFDRLSHFEASMMSPCSVDYENVDRSKRSYFEPMKIQSGDIDLRFASFLNLDSTKEILQNVSSGGIVYIVGVKNGFGPQELSSLLYELRSDFSESIRSITVEHMYMKELQFFDLLFKYFKKLKNLELKSCPFTTAQIKEMCEYACNYKHGLERLAVENALISDQPEELAAAINKTGIKQLKFANPKMKMKRFIEALKNNLSDAIQEVDFGYFKSDPEINAMLSEWKLKKKIDYFDDKTHKHMRATYKY